MSELKVLDAIRTRRSIRIYHPDKPLSAESVQVIMEAALRAPSSKNRHTTQFILVEDKEKLVELSYMRERGCSFLKDVPLAVVVLGSPMECEHWIADASLSAGLLALARVGLMCMDSLRVMVRTQMSMCVMHSGYHTN